eukprot:7457856-Pyramimonas_sp.AAC.1
MIFTTVASALLFGTVITALFMLGTLVACLSCYLYFAEVRVITALLMLGTLVACLSCYLYFAE